MILLIIWCEEKIKLSFNLKLENSTEPKTISQLVPFGIGKKWVSEHPSPPFEAAEAEKRFEQKKQEEKIALVE